ncbi:MAG TPA: nucleotidyltransferase domain-containing protein [Candidatus Bilamarchaeaceae archaeon]|nr:nucleotidyltransferase domain-containing protein [Candidatus Bilamarchaeaceae archaeon]
MQFRDFAENLLGSKVKIKILRRLLTDETITSERELARLIGVSPGAANRVLKELHEANLISPLRVGAATVWQLNKVSYAYVFLTKFAEKIKTTPLVDLKKMIENYLQHGWRDYIVRARLPEPVIQKAVIFGSIAEGTELFSSDIDLFVLVENKQERQKADVYLTYLGNYVIAEYGNRLSLHIFTHKDLQNPKNKKFLENVKKGMVVFEK